MRPRLNRDVCILLLAGAMVAVSTGAQALEQEPGGSLDDIRAELTAIRQLFEQWVNDSRESRLRDERREVERSIAMIGAELQRAARTRLELSTGLADERVRLDAYRQTLAENEATLDDLTSEQQREVESLERFVLEHDAQLEQLKRWEQDLERMLQRNRESRDAIP